MKGKVFLDTNTLIYCYSEDDPVKQQQAVKLASNLQVIISTQVIQELCNTLFRKFKLDWETIGKVADEIEANFQVHTNSALTIKKARQIAAFYKFSFYESLIVAAALESGCESLFSEDLQHGQIIENQLVVRNPFL
jgi:predicted nucleic acid-binding protein